MKILLLCSLFLFLAGCQSASSQQTRLMVSPPQGDQLRVVMKSVAQSLQKERGSGVSKQTALELLIEYDDEISGILSDEQWIAYLDLREDLATQIFYRTRGAAGLPGYSAGYGGASMSGPGGP